MRYLRIKNIRVIVVGASGDIGQIACKELAQRHEIGPQAARVELIRLMLAT